MLGLVSEWLGQGLKSGVYAPTFNLKDQDGVTHTLEEHHGKWLVLYFYPKDNTPGCTAQACSFRDSWSDIKDLGVSLVGISTDSQSVHEEFAKSQNLPFPILSDSDKVAAKDYKVLLPLGFANRVTFIINPRGIIEKTLRFVNWNTYAETLTEELKALISSFETKD
jgi:thioredoxin-dependent peroxiredoxin